MGKIWKKGKVNERE
jgi:S-adenosylmethionine/arginine decarboxylase-like enzyme